MANFTLAWGDWGDCQCGGNTAVRRRYRPAGCTPFSEGCEDEFIICDEDVDIDDLCNSNIRCFTFNFTLLSC